MTLSFPSSCPLRCEVAAEKQKKTFPTSKTEQAAWPSPHSQTHSKGLWLGFADVPVMHGASPGIAACAAVQGLGTGTVPAAFTPIQQGSRPGTTSLDSSGPAMQTPRPPHSLAWLPSQFFPAVQLRIQTIQTTRILQTHFCTGAKIVTVGMGLSRHTAAAALCVCPAFATAALSCRSKELRGSASCTTTATAGATHAARARVTPTQKVATVPSVCRAGKAS